MNSQLLTILSCVHCAHKSRRFGSIRVQPIVMQWSNPTVYAAKQAAIIQCVIAERMCCEPACQLKIQDRRRRGDRPSFTASVVLAHCRDQSHKQAHHPAKVPCLWSVRGRVPTGAATEARATTCLPGYGIRSLRSPAHSSELKSEIRIGRCPWLGRARLRLIKNRRPRDRRCADIVVTTDDDDSENDGEGQKAPQQRRA